MSDDKKLQKEMFKGHMDTVILSVVAEHSPIYGYDIARRVREASEEYISLNAGSLYPSLHRLALRGWMTMTGGPSPRGGAPVTFYAITDAGLKELARRKTEYRKLQAALKPFFSLAPLGGW